MAKNSKGAGQNNSVGAEQDIPDAASSEATLAGAAPVVQSVEASEIALTETPAEIADIVSTPLAVVEEAMEKATEGFAASFSFDASPWSKKSIDLWSENAAAFLALIDELSKARTFEEIVDLQSRYANERLEAFVRQSKELMEVAKNMAAVSAAPLCDVRRAA
jgi:hypothetical protein